MPYAYVASDDDPLVLVPDTEKATLVEEALDFLEEGHSSRKTAEWLASKTGDKISKSPRTNTYMEVAAR